jgi:hypothetical protein
MSVKTCRHIMENGQFCQSPAISKRDYCYYHIEFRARRLKMARARACGERWWLDLPCIEDMRSCQAASTRVFEAAAAGLIEPGHAKLLHSMLRTMASNFKARKAWTRSCSDYHNDCSQNYVGEYQGFEAAHNLPNDIDLNADPLKLFPMPEEETKEQTGAPFKSSFGLSGSENLGSAQRSQILHDAAIPVDYMNLEVTADDIEAWEVAEREGDLAGMKRAVELERGRRRRERRLQRARYQEMARNRNIQTAAMKIAGDQKRAEIEKQRQAAAVLAIPTGAAATHTGDAEANRNPAAAPHQPDRKPAQSETAEAMKAAIGTA